MDSIPRAKLSQILKKRNHQEKMKLLKMSEEKESQNGLKLDSEESVPKSVMAEEEINSQDSLFTNGLDMNSAQTCKGSPILESDVSFTESLGALGPRSTVSPKQSFGPSDESDDSEAVYTSDDEAQNYPSDILSDIREWVRKNPSLPQCLVDSLLRLLHRYHPTLPLSSKTLLKQPQNKKYNIEKFGFVNKGIQSEFVYFGMTDRLKETVNPDLHEESELPLGFNVDGVSLYNSSSKEFWVTSGKVLDKKDSYKPFPISIHCGAGKPADWDAYFDKFITELNTLLEQGIEIDERKFTVKIKCFSCDRQARSYIKRMKGHGGYWACEVCEVEGKRHNKTIYYPVNSAPMRTDTSFRNQENAEHHHGVSPLQKISPEHFNIVDDFMLEFMHQECLGNMKKIAMDHWFKLKKKILTKEQMLMVSQRLMNISSQIPSEFQRTTRSLAEMSKWKATEWRFFLMYSARFIMMKILPYELWRNFMCWNTGCVILDNESLFEIYLDEADRFLNLFCETASDLYGPEIYTINLHNTSHLARDVRNKKRTVTALSAFGYENLYGEMKKSVRSGNKPLQQLCNRMNDCLTAKKPEIEPDFKIVSMKRRQNGSITINKVKYYNCELTTTKPNNLVLLKSGEIVRVKCMESSKKTNKMENIVLRGDKIKILGPGYDYPCDSSIFNVFRVLEEERSEKIEVTLNNVKCKMFMLSIFEFPEDGNIDSYVMPLLHMD